MILEPETDIARAFYERVRVNDRAYHVRFTADLAKQVDNDEFWLVEVIRGANPSVEPVVRRESEHHRFDGRRLVLKLGPDDTVENTYSSIEVASTPRFTQAVLDYLAAVGSLRVMLPGRQAVYRDVVFSPHFADGRAAEEAITTGVCFQSWRGIEKVGLVPETVRPRFMVAWFAYVSGPGIFPAICSRSFKRRHFFASVIDWNAGISWMQPVPDFDPSVPSDITIRWHPNRDMEFLVNQRRVAFYEDGVSRVYPAKLISRQCSRGVNLTGHRFLTADPCHLDFWLTSMVFGNLCEVKNGHRLRHDLSTAVGGYSIEPLW